MGRVVIFGNAGAGKSTLARQLAEEVLPECTELVFLNPGVAA